ncbi:venom allergen 5 isoform X1 [Cimex lectularius]|uniref:SCP domain-containing protein n=2 Tax=Cimex lectularius TaxID=79782 RepID=A0A8I6SMR7_CIMLE|nr:venom allergen 5 isoform X1 [Cimex lectularius]
MSLFKMVKQLVSYLIVFSLMGLSCACSGAKLLKSGGLSCEEKRLIVDAHNRLRQRVALGKVPGQSPAENMLEMSWDDELARGAQKWADQCIFQHNSQNDRRVSRFLVGQNLAMTWSSPHPNSLGDKPDFETQINNWFNEVRYYRGYYSTQVGHYTQPNGLYEGVMVKLEELIWGDTYLVGCGYSYFLKGNQYTKYYVCNYGPAGNVRGFPPYKSGSPACAQHGTTPSRTYPGLCRNQKYLSQPCSNYFYYYYY